MMRERQMRDRTADAMREDARLQPDPELAMSGGHRAGPWQIFFTLLAGAFIVFGVLYGINSQRTEADGNAAGQGATAQAPGSAENVAGGTAQQQNQQAQDQQPAPSRETTGAGEPPAPAQPEQGKPTTSGAER